jgi:hypothetical protein
VEVDVDGAGGALAKASKPEEFLDELLLFASSWRRCDSYKERRLLYCLSLEGEAEDGVVVVDVVRALSGDEPLLVRLCLEEGLT